MKISILKPFGTLYSVKNPSPQKAKGSDFNNWDITLALLDDCNYLAHDRSSGSNSYTVHFG